MSSIYPNNKKSYILSVLTFNDATIWAADAFVGVIIALYITQNISGGTAVHVGLILGMYRIVRAASAIPIGRYLDAHKAHLDEFYSLTASSFAVGIIYFFNFSLAQSCGMSIWGMFFIALAHAFDVTSWRILFLRKSSN